MFKVSIVKCDSYEYEKVYESIKKSIDLIGGLEQFNLSNKKVLLKPNLLNSKPIEKAVTTHPLIIKAVSSLVKKVSGNPIIGDKPGYESLNKVLEKTGIKQICEIPYVDFKEFVSVSCKNGFFKEHLIAQEVLNSPFIINLPKIKTHTHMKLTLSIKNLFGCVTPPKRIDWHLKTGIHKEHFATMLVELYELIKPQLTIVDGVIGMEGDGPSSGDPKKIGLIIAGTNGHSVDRVISEILGIGKNLYTLQAALKKGIKGINLDEIEIVGENIESVKIHNFKFPDTEQSDIGVIIPAFLKIPLKKFFTSKPVIIEKLCKKCKVCLENCPPHAITEYKKKLQINYSVCIKCFCCQEFCPYDAIKIKKGLLDRLKF
ncbi:MAG: DUF362 domain-containing protein [bacterium]